MRFRSINIYSGEQHDGNRKKQITGLLRNDSDSVVNAYLKSFKYYNNENCISLNISCDENILEPFIEDFVKGYPVLHIPSDMTSYSKIPINDKHRFWLKVIYDSIKYVSAIIRQQKGEVRNKKIIYSNPSGKAWSVTKKGSWTITATGGSKNG